MNRKNNEFNEQTITDLRRRAERAKTARIQAQERKAAAERRLGEIEQEMRAMGIDPDCAEDALTRLDADIVAKLAQVEDLLRPFEALVSGNGAGRS
jgi:chromosome segregation ATPase